MKKCTNCKQHKEINEFYKNKVQKDGLQYHCISCLKSRDRKERDSKYSKSEKGKKARAKAWKKYSSKHEVIERRKELRKNQIKRENRQKDLKIAFDPLHKLKCTVRGRLSSFLRSRGLKKKYKMSEYLGCTPQELKLHLQKQFKEGMTWDNHGEWHIDHIVPLSSTNVEEELYKLCHYTNLQPLWASENISKGNR